MITRSQLYPYGRVDAWRELIGSIRRKCLDQSMRCAGLGEGTIFGRTDDRAAGSVLTATVSVIDKVLDAASDTFGVRLVLPNPTMEIPAGVNCTVTFPAPAE